MSVHSTMDITREDALREIERHLRTASDDVLEAILFELTSERNSYNFRIVGSYEGDWHIKYSERGLQTSGDEGK